MSSSECLWDLLICTGVARGPVGNRSQQSLFKKQVERCDSELKGLEGVFIGGRYGGATVCSGATGVRMCLGETLVFGSELEIRVFPDQWMVAARCTQQ